MKFKFSHVLLAGVISANSTVVLAETLTKATGSTSVTTALPHCVDAEADIEKIAQTQKANSKTEFKYDGYKNVLSTDSDADLAARLAYAETKAANCPNKEKQVLPLIYAVIANRIAKRGGDTKSVVFQRDQFASSLNIYSESRYKDFLCPQDVILWSEAKKLSQVTAENKAAPSIPRDAINYYLYRHSERFKAPNWNLEEAKFKGHEDIEDCIRLFLHPKWK